MAKKKYRNDPVEPPPKKGTIYIAGPMRGLPEFNFPAFLQAEAHLRRLNWDVCNPARKDLDVFEYEGTEGLQSELEAQNFDLGEAALWDMTAIITECDAIALLPGWKNSGGAKAEYALARWLGLTVYKYDKHSNSGLQLQNRVELHV
jgi:hypothetical protein